jgi:soluble lytic murein transglycosylase
MTMMPVLKKSIAVAMVLTIATCSGGKSLPPVIHEAASGPPASKSGNMPAVTGPEQGLNAAREAYRRGDAEGALFLARQVALRYPDTASYKRALFVALQALILLDRSDEADAAMSRVRAEYPELADYALFLLAEYHLSKERHSRAAALYQQAAELYPGSPLSVRASFKRGLALYEGCAYAPAIDAFGKFLQDHPETEFSSQAGLGLARALSAEAQPERAVRVYREVWIRHPGPAVDQEVERALAGLKEAGVDVPEWTSGELYERGKNLYRLNQYDKAAEAFAKLLDKEPSSPNRPEALFLSGLALYHLGKRDVAAATLEKMAREYPADPRTPEALYWSGRSHARAGNADGGVKTYQKLLGRFPDSEWADDALYGAGNIFRDAGDMKMMRRYYGRLAKEYPQSTLADSALWWMAWSHYASGEYRKTEQALQDLLNRYPRSFLVNQALYWQGRSAEKRGEFPRAAQYYGRLLKKAPYTYYGYRALERTAGLDQAKDQDKDRGGGLVVKADGDEAPVCVEGPCLDDYLISFALDDGPAVMSDAAMQALLAEPAFTRTLELVHVDLKKEASHELSLLQEKIAGRRGMTMVFSRAFFELGDYHRSLLLVRSSYERHLEGPAADIPEELWLLAYPRGYWDSIRSRAQQRGLDPYFVAAIIREESQFSPEALSRAGARGLMQVMPATGEWAARKIGLSEFDRERLFDSGTAINIGTWYISRLMERFKGDLLLTAAAYNAGPEAVAAWISLNGYGDERDAFVEAIPYLETRNYVKKVLRNYAEYKRIYGGGIAN